MRIYKAFNAYQDKSQIVDKVNDLLTVKDVAGNNEVCVNVLSASNSDVFFGDIEYIQVKKLDAKIFNVLKKINTSGPISYMTREFSDCNNNLISALRCSRDGRLLLLGSNVERFISSVNKWKDRVAEYNEFRTNIETLSEELKSLEKDDPNSEILARRIMSLKDRLKFYREEASPATFMRENYFETGFLYLLRSFTIEYISKNIVIAKVNRQSRSGGYTKHVIDDLIDVINLSSSKMLSIEEEAELLWNSFSGTDDFKLKFNSPVLAGDLWVTNLMEPMNAVNLSSVIEMSGVVPVAPIKSHIMASIMASGTAGNSNTVVRVRDEDYVIKAIMLPEEELTEVFINGEKIIERTSLFKPKMGIFNLLRKEVEILTD